MTSEAKESCSKRASVAALLENVNDFIQSIYSEVGLQSPPTPAPSSRVRNNHRNISAQSSPMLTSNSSSLNSSTSESELNINIHAGSNRRLAFSPPNRHNIDAEIERINSICDNVDNNLRSIGVYVNGRRGDQAPASADGEVRHPSRERHLLSTSDFVDLSESRIETPEALNTQIRQGQTNHLDDGEDDEVVVVASNLPPVIDLCTPGHEDAYRRPTVERSHLPRRVLNEGNQPEVVPVRRRRVSSATSGANKRKELVPAPDHASGHDDSGNDTSFGRDPFICPVCMDSCLRRRPTSTKCGHVYCEQCIKQAIRLTHKCPLCNTRISDKHLIRIYV